MLFTALLICLAVNFSNAEDCSIGNDPVSISPGVNWGDTEIFVIPSPEQSVIANTTVTEFQIFIEHANQGIYIGMFRPTGPSDFIMIGRKHFKPTTTGYHSIPLTPAEYIDVQPGDTIGIQIYEGPAVDTVFGGTCPPATTAHIQYQYVIQKILAVGDSVHAFDTNTCFRPSLKAIMACNSGGLEPHFMITSGNNHMCFNLHGKDQDIYDLISDPITDVYVRGETFEIEKEELMNPLSYFSAIGVSTKNNRIVFTVKGLTVNGKFYLYDDVTKIESKELLIKMKAPNKYLVSVRDSFELMVVISHNDVAEFLGIYTLSKKSLSEQTGGILGQLIHTEFDVNTRDGRLVLDFNDHHESVNVFKISQLATYSKEPIDCYYYSWLTDQALLGDQSNYKKNSITL